ncbi:MAG: FGGY family carbohydrate kinase, partial [Chloroflexota bacterium]
MTEYILAIDQGTTSTRAILFDRQGRAVQQAQQPLKQHFPAPGWVEHNPDEIWNATVQVCRDAADGHAPAAIGITNQRETTIVWDRRSGVPIANAIVWQDRRTAERCTALAEKYDDLVRERSGLLIDSYFSASKIAWILDRNPELRERATRGEVLFGTVDSWLLWKMSDGELHVTDATNASRTMLYNISTGDWDDDLLALWDIPRAMLPEIRDSAGYFTRNTTLCGRDVPVTGVAGDQQAATFGQACFEQGMLKSTYGTG